MWVLILLPMWDQVDLWSLMPYDTWLLLLSDSLLDFLESFIYSRLYTYRIPTYSLQNHCLIRNAHCFSCDYGVLCRFMLNFIKIIPEKSLFTFCGFNFLSSSNTVRSSIDPEGYSRGGRTINIFNRYFMWSMSDNYGVLWGGKTSWLFMNIYNKRIYSWNEDFREENNKVEVGLCHPSSHRWLRSMARVQLDSSRWSYEDEKS